ncbi:MAG: MATE family efflux transporter [Clostridia bacterium]|nr:MATE family efflux transporter [Clostridia bacterium]
MLNQPVHKAICRLAVPTIISMLVTSFYNMADAYFVGSVGGGENSSATAAVGIVFSLMSIIQAVGFFFGHGSGNFISHALGAGNTDGAKKMATVGFGLSLFGGLAITVLGLIFITPLAYLLGATPTSLDYVKDYLSIILVGAPVMCTSCVLNNQLRFQGSAMYGMVGLASGAVLNVGLDWLFITQWGMEVKGAAIATVISQTVGFILLVIGTLQKGNLRLNIKLFKPTADFVKEILRCGTPSLFRQGISSLATVCLNFSAASAAMEIAIPQDDAISAMSIVSRIMFFVAAAVIGFGQGFQPVCGFNYGAKKYDRVLKAFWFCVKVSAVFLVVVSGVGFFFADKVISVFKDNENVITIGRQALQMQLLTHPIMSFVVLGNMMAQNLGKVVRASLLAVARQGVLLIPCVLLLPQFFGMWGIIISQPVADLATFLLTIVLVTPILKELKTLSKQNGSC